MAIRQLDDAVLRILRETNADGTETKTVVHDQPLTEDLFMSLFGGGKKLK